MRTAKILVIDDEPMISGMLYEALQKKSYDVCVADSGQEGLHQIKSNEYDLIITDVYLGDINGIDILKTAKQIEPDTGVIVITGHGSVESAVEAMRVGAYDYLTKGFSIDEIELTVEKFFKYQKLVKENQLLRSELSSRYGISNIIGNSRPMQRIFETVEMVAPTNSTVLIQGPSGTGKELIAKAIHQCSHRSAGPFIKTNCAAIPESLVESELFGHEKGAFTGALRTTKGRFELADGGTLLLDEISEIRPNLQAKLLRVLQEKEFEKVGNPETVKVDVRIIATTNRDLKSEIDSGNFREDLYYRLNVVPIMLPALRERKEDIPLLVDHFIEKSSKENMKRVDGIQDEVVKLMMQYNWPGNVRELENTMERAVVMCRDGRISLKNLMLGLDHDFTNGVLQPSEISFPDNMTLRDIEKAVIQKTLEDVSGNRTRTAEKLGITARTLRNKLREYREQGSGMQAETPS
jgi:DNA-binding NtrC family response regulator